MDEPGITDEEMMIKETVLEILSNSNMDETTEYKVRKTASDKLKLDLSDPHYKKFVRKVVESYLSDQQSKAEEGEREEEEREAEEEESDEKRDKEYDDDGDLIICKLSDKRRVTIQDFKGRTLVSMREYYKKDGKELPTAKGISLTAEQWSTFSKNIPAIENAIKKMESRLH